MNKLSFISFALIINLSDIRAGLSVDSSTEYKDIEHQLYLVDKIECVVCGPERNTPLTNTDETIKCNMDGQLIPMAQQIQNDVVSQQIIAEKIPVDPTAADKYIDTIKKQNNLTDTDLADMFEKIGRTFMEGLALLNQQYFHEMFMHYKFKSQQVVTDDVVQEYYEQNPMFSDGQVEIQVAYIDFNDDTKEQIGKDLDQFIIDGIAPNVTIDWSSPITISMRDIADDKRFIVAMTPSQVSVHEGPGSFELYKLISKNEPKMKALEEVRSSIVETLTRQKLEKMLEENNQEVRKFIDIINLSDV